MKRRLCLCILLAAVSFLDAQIIHDPNDRLYRDLDLWAARGYITRTLPMVRPYPAQLIDLLLEEVIEGGDESAALAAARYQEALSPGSRILHGGFTGSVEGLDGDASLLGAPFVDGTLWLRNWLAGSFSMFVYGSTMDPGSGYNVPGTYSPYPDMISDVSDMGVLRILQNWTSALAIGTGDFYFQSGLVRSSLGPFYGNGLIVGPQASRAGHFGLAYLRPKWSFEMLWLELVASDTRGNNRFPNKHMAAHIFSFRPVPEFEISFLESIVWGGRIEPLYMIPFNQLFAAQSMADFGDNSFIGLLIRWAFAPNALFLTQLYIDDLHFNDMIRFHFNTKYKLAGELGIVWAPPEGPLLSLEADYTAVLPYMYTHMYSLDPTTFQDRYTNPRANYQDYSHAGKNLGPGLEPNSDRISLRSFWKTLPGLDLGLSAYLVRHGNASKNMIEEGLMDGTWHDGSIFDDGSTDDGGDNNYRRLRFLVQPYLEIKLAGGISLLWRFSPAFGDFTLGAEYTAEYGWNRGGIPENNGFLHYWSLGGTYRY
ncbi:MAG: hypothetical protein LBD31_11245 [Treponema sp.]|nr:hypothetical protein [Treponema sp.]